MNTVFGLIFLGYVALKIYQWRTGTYVPSDNDDSDGFPAINPATGLPMAGPGTGGIDIGGNVYGTSPSDDD